MGVFSLAVRSGSVSKVKILGCLGMIDDGETDWKVICINADDPLASQLNDIGDVERVLPGYISVIREWLVRALPPSSYPGPPTQAHPHLLRARVCPALGRSSSTRVSVDAQRMYKTVDGKPVNQFGLGEKAQNREYTMQVIQETHEFWKKLTATGAKTV